MTIHLKRSYEPASPDDGYRVLVDRLWPRGLKKSEAKVARWLKDIAPSSELRHQFHDQAISWNEFRKAYLSELTRHREQLRALKQEAAGRDLTLVFSAKDTEHNNAVVVRQYLRML